MAWTRTAAAALSCGLLLLPVAPARPAQPAEPARLAVRSLLLGAARAGERLVCVGERGHVLYSDDHGHSWQQARVPTQATLTAVTFPTPREGWAVGHDRTILHTEDGGAIWTLQFDDPGTDQPLLDVWFRDPMHGFAIGAYGQYLVTDNGGASWAAKRVSDEDLHLNALVTDPQTGAMYIAGEAGALYVSQDQGLDWRRLESPYDGSLFGILLAPGHRLYAFGLRGHLLRSDDMGASFQEVDTGSEATLMGGTVMPDGTVVIAGLSGAILVATPGADRFTLQVRPDRVGNAAALPSGAGDLLLFGENGVQHQALPVDPGAAR